MRRALAVLSIWALCAPALTQERVKGLGSRIHGERDTAHALAIVPWRERGTPPLPLGVERLLIDPPRPLERTVFENRLRLHRQRHTPSPDPE